MSSEIGAEHHDARDLAQFGYQQELKRGLGVYSSFAVAFSYISPSTGIFTLFALGLGIGGAFFFWSWPLVALGQLIIALNFAEVSAHFPVAGSVYQWSKYLSNRHYSWFTGWIYLFAGILTVGAVDLTVPVALLPLLQNLGINVPATIGPLAAPVVVGLLVLISTTLLNIYGVRLVAIVNNTGVVFEILGMVVFALVLLLFFSHQSAGVVFNTNALTNGANGSPAGTFMAAMFMSLFVIYGFDTASTLAEETRNPRREAPRAVVAAVVGAFVIGAVFLFSIILAVPGSMDKYVDMTAAGKVVPPVSIIQANLPNWAASIYLFVVSAAIYVCCLAIQTATIRLAFGMSRDGRLPASGLMKQVNHNLHTPVGACIGIGIVAAIPMFYAGAGTVAIAATGLIYVSYLLGNLAVLIARQRGWPKAPAPFKLGGWGLIVNLLALLWGGAMLVNFLWPRPGSAINPQLSSLPNLPPLGAIGNIPIFEAVLGIIVIVGAIYWAVAQRNKEATAPPGEAVSATAG